MKLGTAIFWVAAAIVGFAVLAQNQSDQQNEKAPAAAKAPKADFIPVGANVVVTTGWVGCREQADLDRAKDLAARQRDVEAAARYTAVRDCRAMKTGVMGVAEDISVWHASICVRRPGEPNCYWFPTPFLRKAE